MFPRIFLTFRTLQLIAANSHLEVEAPSPKRLALESRPGLLSLGLFEVQPDHHDDHHEEQEGLFCQVGGGSSLKPPA